MVFAIPMYCNIIKLGYNNITHNTFGIYSLGYFGESNLYANV